MHHPDDEHWMRLALQQAQAAAAEGEVPVGAVIVKDGQLLATGRNAPVAGHDPTAHAEVQALRAAAQALGNYRLNGCTLYVTLEPCAMCAGAMLHARLGRVVFGAPDARTGVAGSVINLFAQPQLNHHTRVQGGVLAAECAALLQGFFKPRRANPQPLRDDALRTPSERFAALADYPWPALGHSHHVSHLPALAGLRLHYLDVPALTPDGHPLPDAPALLCLHDAGQWSYAFTHTARQASAAGWRVLAPDLIGHGQSDKPKKPVWHCHHPSPHLPILQQWLAWLGVQRLAWCSHGAGQAAEKKIGQGAETLGQTLGQALAQSTPACTWLPAPAQLPDWLAADRPAVQQPRHPAWQAPYPDAGHTAALRAGRQSP